jgi:hypothetical protein
MGKTSDHQAERKLNLKANYLLDINDMLCILLWNW